MKFAKTLIALAVVGASASSFAASNIATGAAAAAISATAALDFRVAVPRIIYLQVGTGTAFAANATVDLVTFSLTAGQVTGGGAVAGTSGAAITARVLGNGGAVNFSAAGSGTGLTNTGLATIPWSQITGTGSAGLPHPTIGGAATVLPATLGIVNQTTTFTFSYANATQMAAGNYNGTVTYTAALP